MAQDIVINNIRSQVSFLPSISYRLFFPSATWGFLFEKIIFIDLNLKDL